MKNYFFAILLLVLFLPSQNKACAGGNQDYDFFNLLPQNLIQNTAYYPFMYNAGPDYYDFYNYETGEDEIPNLQNDNIKDWQKWLKNTLTYNQTKKLIYTPTLDDIVAYKKGTKTETTKLIDLIPKSKKKPFIQYLQLAKEIEPYAVNNRWYEYSWNDEPKEKIKDETLEYTTIIHKIKSYYTSTKDKELKLRYGYQMVRLAHYYYQFHEAVDFFTLYVEPLKIKTPIYYYALEQKGGALKSLGKKIEAQYCFVQSFLYTSDRKTASYTSYKFTNFNEVEQTLSLCKNNEEKATVYFFLGYNDFQNPIESIQKVIELSPNSALLQVLVARTINQLEREINTLNHQCYYTYFYEEEYECAHSGKLIPTHNPKNIKFLQDFLPVMQNISNLKQNLHSDYYLLAYAYTHFLNKDFKKAQSITQKLHSKNKAIIQANTTLQMILEVVLVPKIDETFENQFYQNYKSTFDTRSPQNYLGFYNVYYSENTALQYVLDVMANKYYNQNETAKSFLCHNNSEALEYHEDLEILNALEHFYSQKNPTIWEEYLGRNFSNYSTNIENVYELKANYYLKHYQVDRALSYFNKIENNYQPKVQKYNTQTQEYDWVTLPGKEFDGYNNISSNIFYQNIKECFNCTEEFVMQNNNTELQYFNFIPKHFNKKELAKIVKQLTKIAEKNNKFSATAYYLLGNFYYNITDYGYYRNILHYELGNGNGAKFNLYNYYRYKSEKESPNYYKYISSEVNTFTETERALFFFDKAYKMTSDKELKAKIAYGGAKAEQGEYYNLGLYREYENETSAEFYTRVEDIKMKNYKKYFSLLQSDLSDTEYAKKVESNCKYFSYYLSK